ncbi:glycosyltransferase [Williamsia sp. D3]|uniref:glycosyltransferase n=1 Tax=Williamsia sp. D3 TaxID=1313067 RepID=UPI00350EAF8B
MPELPSPCECGDPIKTPGSVVFVGTFDDRKGVTQLLESWSHVQESNPDAFLTIMGQGPLATEVERLSGRLSNVEVVYDPPRVEIHRAFRFAEIGVLLSQPNERWREQLGLPIFEAVAHGAEVIASAESGLAGWLQNNGHAVLEAHASPAELGASINLLLQSPRDPAVILAQLPETHGRISADRWLVREPVLHARSPTRRRTHG